MEVLVSEVGPRDGLQSIKRAMPTAVKHQWIRALAAAGLREIEVASFVPPKLLPQMADAPEVVREALKIPGITVLALVPNLRGFQDAVAAGTPKITVTVSASEAHSMNNIRMSCAEAVESLKRMVQFRNGLPHGPKIEVGVSTAFGCTLQGDVPEDFALEMAVRCAEAGADTVGLSDSVGYANPAQVKRMFKRLIAELGDKAGGAHLHNTRGQGLANVVAALDAGVTTFDASQGGIGGCPYAPGATGNIVTEDLVFLLEAMGLDTGIDMAKLVDARKYLLEGLPGEPVYGFIPDAGLPKTFRPARTLSPAFAGDRAHPASSCDLSPGRG